MIALNTVPGWPGLAECIEHLHLVDVSILVRAFYDILDMKVPGSHTGHSCEDRRADIRTACHTCCYLLSAEKKNKTALIELVAHLTRNFK